MMWKKRISLLLITVLTLSLMVFAVGCSSEEKVDNPAPVDQPKVEVDEAAIVYQASKDYFDYLPDGVMVKPDKVKDTLANYYIVDLRSAEAYAEGHIEGAVNIGIKELGKNMDQFPKNKPLLMVCYSGQNANQATGVLRMAGFEAYAMIGGMGGWNGAQLPTVK